MSNKIAVMVAGPCAGYASYLGDPTPNHYRYVLYENRFQTGKKDWQDRPEYKTNSNLLLRYEGMTIIQLLQSINVSFGLERRRLQARMCQVIPQGNKFYVQAEAVVSGNDHVIAHSLGNFMDHDLYVIYQQSDVEARDALTYFSIHKVPGFGRASVAYDREVARRSFTGIDITQTIHEEGSMSKEDSLALFDHMDKLIAPIMEPMIALLPPVKERQ